MEVPVHVFLFLFLCFPSGLGLGLPSIGCGGDQRPNPWGLPQTPGSQAQAGEDQLHAHLGLSTLKPAPNRRFLVEGFGHRWGCSPLYYTPSEGLLEQGLATPRARQFSILVARFFAIPVPVLDRSQDTKP